MSGYSLPHYSGKNADMVRYYRVLTTKLKKMGRKTTRVMKMILEENGNISREERGVFIRVKREWQAYMIETYHFLGELKVMPFGKGGDEVYHSWTLQLFIEVTRIHVILNKTDLPELSRWRISDHPELKEALGDVGNVVEDENIGVLLYNLDEIKETIFRLIGIIDQIPYSKALREFVDLIELKCGTFFCQTMPGLIVNNPSFRIVIGSRKKLPPLPRIIQAYNDTKKRYENELEMIKESGYDISSKEADILSLLEPKVQEAIIKRKELEERNTRATINRKFLIFCTIYLTKIRRRLYYQSMIPKRVIGGGRSVESLIPEGALERLKEWCGKLAEGLADNFAERFSANCREAYSFPGDKQWYNFRYPRMSKTIEAQVKQLRPETARAFFAENNVSAENALERADKSVAARFFVIDLIDRWFMIYRDLRWRDGYVVKNEDIESQFDKLSKSKDPFIVQVFSTFWIWLGAKVLVVDDIYSAICLWLVCVRKSRRSAGLPKDTLFGNIYIGDIIDKILKPKEETGGAGADNILSIRI